MNNKYICFLCTFYFKRKNTCTDKCPIYKTDTPCTIVGLMKIDMSRPPTLHDKTDTLPILVDRWPAICMGKIIKTGLKDIFMTNLNAGTDVNPTTDKTMPNRNRCLPEFDDFYQFQRGGLSAIINVTDTAGRNCSCLKRVMILDNDVSGSASLGRGWPTLLAGDSGW